MDIRSLGIVKSKIMSVILYSTYNPSQFTMIYPIGKIVGASGTHDQVGTTAGCVRKDAKDYNKIMTSIFIIPDVFSGAKILELPAHTITVWDEGIEVKHTSQPKRHHLEYLPMRFFINKDIIHAIRKGEWSHEDGSTYKTIIISYNDNEISIRFTDVDDCNIAYTFIQDYLFPIAKPSIDMLVEM
jgi:hypothetical protein